MRTLALLVLLLGSAARAEEPVLVFQRSGKEVARIGLSRLLEKVAPKTVTLHDQMRRKSKTYRALPIRDVMRLAYGPRWTGFPQSEAAILALDGYASMSPASKLDEEGGWLAFEDVDTPGWEPIGRKKANPAPFYLVWEKDAQSTANEYPWPYQIATVNLVKFEERYPELVPTGAAAGSPAALGFKLFRGQCLRCHAINTQGGKIGPDLNAPQSVTSYRTKEWITSYVRQPSKYRYTEMPDHGHLTDADLENLYAYLLLKASQPEKPWDK